MIAQRRVIHRPVWFRAAPIHGMRSASAVDQVREADASRAIVPQVVTIPIRVPGSTAAASIKLILRLATSAGAAPRRPVPAGDRIPDQVHLASRNSAINGRVICPRAAHAAARRPVSALMTDRPRLKTISTQPSGTIGSGMSNSAFGAARSTRSP